jgi:hypothetical protein
MNSEIKEYNNRQTASDKEICDILYFIISLNLPQAENKIWHAHPVWFIDGNPILGYSKLKNCIRLLFWSGQSFDEENLKSEGKFKAAEIRYISLNEINVEELTTWIDKSVKIQWDYKNIIKRKGKLVRLY